MILLGEPCIPPRMIPPPDTARRAARRWGQLFLSARACQSRAKRRSAGVEAIGRLGFDLPLAPYQSVAQDRQRNGELVVVGDPSVEDAAVADRQNPAPDHLRKERDDWEPGIGRI